MLRNSRSTQDWHSMLLSRVRRKFLLDTLRQILQTISRVPVVKSLGVRESY